MYKVSIITPVYNAGPYIERCARSLFGQTLDSLEYIFVNDCTPDNSMEVLAAVMEEYPERKPHVKILNHTVNTGQSGARKDGMAIASGEFIIHCDADDWVDLDTYERLYNKAIEDGVEAVCCDMAMEFVGSTVVLKPDNRFDDHRLMYDCIAPISVEYMSMCNRLISRKVFERHTVEPFKGVNMWDDVGLAIRLRYYIRSTSVINEPFYHYNRMNEVSTTKRPLMDRIREQLLCIEYLDEFFRNENALEKYKKFLSFLKIHTADELFRVDVESWLSIFKSERRNLWKIRHLYKTHLLIKYYIVSCSGPIGKHLWKKLWKR